MGTRYQDQPVEHWAGPESLDPTPVWKQYLLVALLLVVGLVAVIAVSVAALAPYLATPPALVAGDRLVLSASDVPAVNGAPRLVSAPLVDVSRSFYLVQPAKGEVLALRSHWVPRPGEPECRVVVLSSTREVTFTAMDCPPFAPARTGIFETAIFDIRGAPASAAATHRLDQYLVSVSGDRVIVNLSRVIQADERTNAPVPTGIPQPQQP
jgi:hypothetical protein